MTRHVPSRRVAVIATLLLAGSTTSVVASPPAEAAPLTHTPTQVACHEGFCGSPVDPVWPLPIAWLLGIIR
jgi:hypothetical protein